MKYRFVLLLSVLLVGTLFLSPTYDVYAAEVVSCSFEEWSEPAVLVRFGIDSSKVDLPVSALFRTYTGLCWLEITSILPDGVYFDFHYYDEYTGAVVWEKAQTSWADGGDPEYFENYLNGLVRLLPGPVYLVELNSHFHFIQSGMDIDSVLAPFGVSATLGLDDGEEIPGEYFLYTTVRVLDYKITDGPCPDYLVKVRVVYPESLLGTYWVNFGKGFSWVKYNQNSGYTSKFEIITRPHMEGAFCAVFDQFPRELLESSVPLNVEAYSLFDVDVGGQIRFFMLHELHPPSSEIDLDLADALARMGAFSGVPSFQSGEDMCFDLLTALDESYVSKPEWWWGHKNVLQVAYDHCPPSMGSGNGWVENLAYYGTWLEAVSYGTNHYVFGYSDLNRVYTEARVPGGIYLGRFEVGTTFSIDNLEFEVIEIREHLEVNSAVSIIMLDSTDEIHVFQHYESSGSYVVIFTESFWDDFYAEVSLPDSALVFVIP